MQTVDHWLFMDEDGRLEFCSIGRMMPNQTELGNSGVFMQYIRTNEELEHVENLSSTR